MKSKFLKNFLISLTITISFIFFMFFLYQVYLSHRVKEESIKVKYEENMHIINFAETEQNTLISSVSLLLSSEKDLKEAIKNKQRDKIFSIINEKWDILKNNFKISEIHIVDADGNSLVNFTKSIAGEIKEKDRYNLSAFRKDISSAIKHKRAKSTLYVCRYFVGIRTIYPVIYKGKVVGAISVGKDIKEFIPVIRKYLQKEVFIVLDEEKIGNCLKPKIVRKLSEDNFSFEKFIILGSVDPQIIKTVNGHIKTSKGYNIYEVHGANYLISFYPLVDFNENTVGYIAVIDNITYIINSFNTSIMFLIITYFIILAGLIIIIYLQSKSFERRISEITELTDNLANKNFSVLNKYENIEEEIFGRAHELDDIEILKLNVIKMGEELRDFINNLNRKIKRFAKESYVDPLTGVLNRRALSKIGENEFENMKIRSLPLSVLVMDIDFFKKINDTYGHDIGDIVLKNFSSILKQLSSKRDLIFRLGGEEFLIVLPGATKEKAKEIAEKIRKFVEDNPVKTPAGYISYTVSIGVAQMEDEDGNIYDLIIKADKKLYEAKKTGRNKVVD